MSPLDERLLVGIDFSKSRADFALLHPDGQPLQNHRSFANSLVGFQKAKTLLLEALGEHSYSGLDIAGEATNYYWLPFFLHLAQDPDLAAYQPHLFLLNARWVHWYKKSLSPDHKDDARDPHYIADRIRFKRPQTEWKPDLKWMPLRFYTRMRRHLVKSLVRSKNLFQVYLFLAYSTYSQHRPFSDALALTSQRLLSQPELLDSLTELSLDELAAELDEMSGHRLHEPLKNARQLQLVLADSFPQDKALSAPLQNMLAILLDTLSALQAQIKRLDDLVSALVRQDYPEVGWLDSIPGIGLVYASGIAAEIGDIQRFSQVRKWDRKQNRWRIRRSQEVVDAVAKYAGLWWPKNASGNFEAEERRLKREGNAYLRYYVLEAADSLRRHVPSFAAYYQKKYQEATRHHHKRAIVLTGCKALGLFVNLLRHERTYRAEEGPST
jgi:transposase